jgi:hypothetical protein
MLKFALCLCFAAWVGIAQPAHASGDIFGQWTLVEINGEAATDPLRLILTPEGDASSPADVCNQFGYRFKRAGEDVVFIWADATMTTAGCRAPHPPQLNTFTRILRQQANIRVTEDGTLVVVARDGQTMRLQRRATAP